MAAVEKICEFSGEYPRYLMWEYKRNHIQIMPKYRKKFRGHCATLHIFEDKLKEVYPGGGCSNAELKTINPNPTEESWDNHEYWRYTEVMPWRERRPFGKFFNNLQEYKQGLKRYKMRLLMQYAYILEVPTVPGDVGGIYTNYSFDMKSTVRRLSRMVGKKNLKVIKHKGSMYEFLENLEKHDDK